MHRGVVWKGSRRYVALTVGLTVGIAPLLGATSASAATPPSPKGKAHVVGTFWGDKESDKAALNYSGRNDAQRDPGSLFTITNAIGAREVWKQKDGVGRAITGQGVTVAVLDSGVAAVPGLDGLGKIIRGPDLSLEANSDAELGHDTFGHGTHMAGIIAAKDPVPVDGKSGAPKAEDATKQLGVAPDAKLLALKLATTDGSTDVSQVIAALDWVAEHQDDNGMNVRVVNLSFGTASLQPYELDPLAAAAENAWRHGLVVVVSGGNGGAHAGRLTNPAIDPYVIAVGAADPKDRADGWKNAIAASFSSRGTAERHVDLLAPGRSVVGLRNPGSYVDVNHPEGRVSGDTGERLFRGSGTSQAAAVVSGSAALLLQAYPNLTPDAVKAALVTTASPLRDLDPLDGGSGLLDVRDALEAVKRTAPGPSGLDLSVATETPKKVAPVRDSAAAPWAAVQTFPVATGTGSLEEARGGSNLVDTDTGEMLSGEVDVQGMAWDAAGWSHASANGTAWDGGTWMRARWSGDGWTSNGWARARWSGDGWSRARWSEANWERARWSRARWSDANWERARWSSGAWS